MTNLRLSRLALLTLVLGLSLTGFGCKTTDPKIAALTAPVTLNYWRVFDGSDAFSEVIEKYRAKNPHVVVDYRMIPYDEYERVVKSALAEGRGPDILSVHNTWLPAWRPFLAAAPAAITMPKRIVSSSQFNQEVKYEIETKAGPTIKTIQDSFVDGVSGDVVMPTPPVAPSLTPVPQVYGQPLASDSLALYYNRDLLDNAGIS